MTALVAVRLTNTGRVVWVPADNAHTYAETHGGRVVGDEADA